FDARERTYLDGYWQSEKYFIDVADTIRREFTVDIPGDGSSRELADRIATSESVSVHIRRGDYVSDPRKSEARSVCAPDYYRRCVTRVAGLLAEPHVLRFSGDAGWGAGEPRWWSRAWLLSGVPARREAGSV